VGSLLNNGQEVVSNSGDRVVTLLPTGEYEIYRDDDAILRQPGSTIRTETFSDGSTRTILLREDQSQVVTIRDDTGRVLRGRASSRRASSSSSSTTSSRRSRSTSST
jgi:hypothetical protein